MSLLNTAARPATTKINAPSNSGGSGGELARRSVTQS